MTPDRDNHYENISPRSVTCRTLDISAPPGALLGALAGQVDPVMLDSSALHETFGRYTILTCCPMRVLTLREGVLADGQGVVLAERDDGAIFSALEKALSFARLAPSSPRPDGYLPGWFGFVGYEVARHVESLPGSAVRDTPLPDLRLAFYDAILVHDAVERTWRLVSLNFENNNKNVPTGAGLAAEALLSVAGKASDLDIETHAAPAESADAAPQPSASNVEANFSPDEYRRAVARCIEYIAAGDIFQVNLSQRFVVHDAPQPLAIYRALRRRNPAWYAAYMSFHAEGQPCAVISSSPELFLRVRDGHVVTRPIKGTRPRTGDREIDAAAAANLLKSPKDNAELAMIIDLLRNDIGRLCRFGSVRVTSPCSLETHPTVFHLAGTVEGDLRAGVGPADLLRATFPGGSITGAPKIRAMEIIDELEPSARGVYTGCVGTVGVDGSCEWNIAIRTILCVGDAASLQVGGGIVADSDPQEEYQETLDKARAMLEAIGQAQRTTNPKSENRNPKQ